MESDINGNLRIRPAVPGEAADLTKLARTAKAYWGYPRHWLERWEPELTLTAEYVATHTVRVAVRAEGLCGFYALVQNPAYWELAHLWVRPAWIGRGVGKRLFTHGVALASCSGPARLLLDSDPHAEGFYRQMGARLVAHVPAPMDGMPRTLPQFELRLDR